MRRTKPLRVFTGEDKRYRGRPLFEAIALASREQGLRGARVFEGFIGCAPHADISTAGILVLAENIPIVVDLVDEEERISPFLRDRAFEEREGMVACSVVESEQVILDEGAG